MATRRICYIAAAGETPCEPFSPAPGDLTIASDGGYSALTALGITPDLAVGDFDSLGAPPEGVEVMRHPKMKDDTDTMLAIQAGMDRGFDTFVIYGGLGGRLDHSLANIQALTHIAHRGGRGFLVGGGQNITVIADGDIRFAGGHSGTVSVFALGGEARGVDLTGLLYPLENAVIVPDRPLGVSNEFTGGAASVAVCRGTLLVMWQGAFDKSLLRW